MPEKGITFADQEQAKEYAKIKRKQGFQVFTRTNKAKGTWTVYAMEKAPETEVPTDLGELLGEEDGSGVKGLEKARRETRKYGAEVERYGGRTARKAITGAEEPISGIPGAKIVGTTARHIAKQASMRKVIPVAAASREGLTYFARIGKVGAPKITEQYVGEETPRIATMPSPGIAGVGATRMAAMPSPSIVAMPSPRIAREGVGSSSIAIQPQQPKIATPTPIKSAGKLTGIPYLKKSRKEQENEVNANNI